MRSERGAITVGRGPLRPRQPSRPPLGPATLEVHYDQTRRREQELLARRLRLKAGDVLSVGCGWHPGRHLFPRPQFRMTGVELDAAITHRWWRGRQAGRGDRGEGGRARRSPTLRSTSCSTAWCCITSPTRARSHRPSRRRAAAAPGRGDDRGGAGRCTRSGGPGAGEPAGAWPGGARNPRTTSRSRPPARSGRPAHAGLAPEVHALTYGWRRLPPRDQRALHPIDQLGSRAGLAPFGHTLMLIARAPASCRLGHGLYRSAASSGRGRATLAAHSIEPRTPRCAARAARSGVGRRARR